MKILIHGFNNNSTGRRFPQDMKNGKCPNESKTISYFYLPVPSKCFLCENLAAYLENTDHNIIVVDWGAISTPRVPRRTQADVFYPVVVENVPMVGEHVGKFIIFMLDNAIIRSLDQVHILGFSLGAHGSE